MKLKNVVPVIVASATLGLATPNIAHAGAYAFSNININNLDISFSIQGTVEEVTFDSSANAVSEGFSGDATADSSFGLAVNGFAGLSNPDADQATSGTLTYTSQVENKFTPITSDILGGTFSGATGSRADSIIRSSSIVSGFATLTEVETVAEAERQSTGNGNANGNVGSTTAFEYTFTVGDAFTVTFDFDAIVAMRTLLDDATGFARSDVDAGFTIKDSNGTEVFNWSPNGTLLGGITGGSESADGAGCSLNDNIAATILDHDADVSCSGHYTATTDVLGTGVYTLALSSHAGVALDAVIPEPTSIALLGLGMIGMGFTAGKKRKAK